MKILVCVKIVRGEINPFDASALECALRLSEDVTVVSLGPESTKNALLPLTRLGAGVTLISDPVFAGSDTLATSYILSKAIRKMPFDLILCGRQSVDGDTAQVGPMLSEMLGVPLITNAMEVHVDNDRVKAKTRLSEENAALPCVVTLERGYVLRFPSLFSKAGEIQTLSNADLMCDEKRCGLSGSPTRVLKTYENERGRRNCTFISADALFSVIEEAKSKEAMEEKEGKPDEKLPFAWAVGEAAAEKAREIAEEVRVLPETDPREIANIALAEKPDVIIWNADIWGRKNAPIAAAILQTGLCADCTKLAACGGELIMYRPAGGGNVYAKIKCLTRPQMATVRTKSQSAEVIVAGGKGISDQMAKLRTFAEKLSAEVAASRGLVDMGRMPYDTQVGLTGKMVSPKVYVAIGVSGAAQHVCAIEGAETVIAINPDKDAPIFSYADYGILANFEDIVF